MSRAAGRQFEQVTLAAHERGSAGRDVDDLLCRLPMIWFLIVYGAQGGGGCV
jgi:hypothetical protein